MNRYGAFLRGVNVQGTRIKMEDLKKSFEKAGMKEVKTLLASGNVVFSSTEKAEDLKEVLESAILDAFGHPVPVWVLGPGQVENWSLLCPFEKETESHIYCFISEDSFSKTLSLEFEKAKKEEGEEGKLVDNQFYWKVSKGLTLGTEFGKILGKKKYRDFFTSRNLSTLEKMQGLF